MTDMTDDPTQDELLASAYLDGEVTPDERARVEGDPELLAEVDRIRQVRAIVMADIEPAPVSTRESHLAAALDVWDQLAAGDAAPGLAAATPISTVRDRRTRRRAERTSGDRSRLLLGAAAGLVVLAGVGAVVRGVIVGGDDDADFSADDAAAEEPAEEDSAIGPAESDIATEFEGGNTGSDELRDIDTGEVAQDAVAAESAEVAEESDDAMEEPAEDDAMSDDAAFDADEPADEPAEEAADGDDSVSAADDPPAEVDLVELRNAQDLADFAAPAAYAPDPDGGVDLEAPFTACGEEPPDGLGIDRLAEPAIIDGEILTVGVDLDDGVAYAYRDDCEVVLDAVLPTEEEFLAAQAAEPVTTDAP
ncbi:MAG: hypothetical protein AAFP84_08570 [Actinomycetota bacterium]